MVILMVLLMAGVALGADSVLRATASDVVVALDKNGNEYVRIIVSETKVLEGITYKTGTPVMAFGALVVEAKKIKKGQKFTAVVSQREYRGRTSYTVLAFK